MTQAKGATSRGAHYLGDWRTCPIKAFNRYMRHHPDHPDSQGLEPHKTAQPLLVGWAMHEFLEAWYRSRSKDGEDTGEPNFDLAMAMLEKAIASRHHEFDPDQYQPALDLTKALAMQYHDHWGPGGAMDEYREKVLILSHDDQGEPLVEREFQFPLGYTNLDGEEEVFSVRLDLVGDYYGFLSVVEHKTTAASSEARLYVRMSMDAQAVGEYTALHLAWPSASINGIVVNGIVKNRGAKSGKPAFNREIVTFQPEDAEQFLRDACTTLEQRDSYLDNYRRFLAAGLPEDEAAARAFPQFGRSTGGCVGFSACPYLHVCRAPGRERETTRAFRPRSVTVTEPEEGEYE